MVMGHMRLDCAGKPSCGHDSRELQEPLVAAGHRLPIEDMCGREGEWLRKPGRDQVSEESAFLRSHRSSVGAVHVGIRSSPFQCSLE